MPTVRAVFLIALLLAPAAAAAQTVQGRVLDHAEGTPVEGAVVTLEDSTGQVIRRSFTNERGGFWLWHTAPGAYRLSVERIGYAAVTGQAVRLELERVVQVEIRLEAEAVPVEPLRVVARRQVEPYTTDEFYDRMSRHADRGQFITHEDIADGPARFPSDVLRMARGTFVRPTQFGHQVLLTPYGSPCQPSLYLNGHEIDPASGGLDDWVMLDRIEGIEIYSGHFAPGHYANFDDSNWGCGYILVWTRPEPDPRFAFTWERFAVFGVLAALVAVGMPF